MIMLSRVTISQPRAATCGIQSVSSTSGLVMGRGGRCRLWMTAPGWEVQGGSLLRPGWRVLGHGDVLPSVVPAMMRRPGPPDFISARPARGRSRRRRHHPPALGLHGRSGGRNPWQRSGITLISSRLPTRGESGVIRIDGSHRRRQP
jgi:hypothetical protein